MNLTISESDGLGFLGLELIRNKSSSDNVLFDIDFLFRNTKRFPTKYEKIIKYLISLGIKIIFDKCNRKRRTKTILKILMNIILTFITVAESWDYTLFEYQKNISDAKQTAPNPYKNQKSIIYTPLILRNRFNQPFYHPDTEYKHQ